MDSGKKPDQIKPDQKCKPEKTQIRPTLGAKFVTVRFSLISEIT